MIMYLLCISRLTALDRMQIDHEIVFACDNGGRKGHCSWVNHYDGF